LLSAACLTSRERIRNPNEASISLNLRTSVTDSRSLIFVDHSSGYSNLFRTSMANNLRKRLTNFKSDRISAYAFSKDGKKIAILRGSQASDVLMLSNFH